MNLHLLEVLYDILERNFVDGFSRFINGVMGCFANYWNNGHHGTAYPHWNSDDFSDKTSALK